MLALLAPALGAIQPFGRRAALAAMPGRQVVVPDGTEAHVDEREAGEDGEGLKHSARVAFSARAGKAYRRRFLRLRRWATNSATATPASASGTKTIRNGPTPLTNDGIAQTPFDNRLRVSTAGPHFQATGGRA